MKRVYHGEWSSGGESDVAASLVLESEGRFLWEDCWSTYASSSAPSRATGRWTETAESITLDVEESEVSALSRGITVLKIKDEGRALVWGDPQIFYRVGK